jgi:hypothetical protein
MVMIEQISRRMVYLGDGSLEIYLCLNEVQLGLGQHDLRIKNKENRLRSQFVLAFIGTK